jgi:hypothetical protein
VFDEHLKIIKSKLEISNEIKPGTVLITFDDGFKNNYLVAAPILKKHGVNATFFVPACYFESPDILWVDKMLMWVSFVPVGHYTLCENIYIFEADTQRTRVWDAIWQWLLSNFTSKDQLLADMDQSYAFSELTLDPDYRKLRFEALEKHQIEEMADSGNKIGCHSYNHDILSKLSDNELLENFKKCHSHRSDYTVNWFSYPFGRESEVSEKVVEECRNFGYSHAFMNIVNPSGENAFRIPRINMPNTVSKVIIHAKLSGFEALLKKILR